MKEVRVKVPARIPVHAPPPGARAAANHSAARARQARQTLEKEEDAVNMSTNKRTRE